LVSFRFSPPSAEAAAVSLARASAFPDGFFGEFASPRLMPFSISLFSCLSPFQALLRQLPTPVFFDFLHRH
jgi:hypothetical protein